MAVEPDAVVIVEPDPVVAVEEATGCGAGVVGVATAIAGLGWFNIVVITASEMP